MLRSAKEITGYSIEAPDGSVGKVADLYFDDVGWFVRYVVADTGGWLSGRRVLVAPEVFGTPDWAAGELPVHVPKKVVEESPPIDEDAPVSRQQEERLRAFYGWPMWWTTPTHGMMVPSSREVVEAQTRGRDLAVSESDPNLRSMREVDGYGIEATDGGIGRVEDFIVDDETWAVRYLVVDTRTLLPGKKVILAPDWIARVRWADEKVSVGLTREQIRSAPEYDPSQPVNRRYEERVYDFYGRPKYWEGGPG